LPVIGRGAGVENALPRGGGTAGLAMFTPTFLHGGRPSIEVEADFEAFAFTNPLGVVLIAEGEGVRVAMGSAFLTKAY